MSTIASRAGWLLDRAVVLAVLAVLAAAVVVPRLAGATPYAVETGSMRPGLPPGTLVVVRPVDPETIGVGTVVTYQLRSGEDAVVTHRVVATAYDGQGRLRLQTQGDANDVPDQEWVRPEQVRGERWYAVPWVGHLSGVLTGRQHAQVGYGIGGLLAAYALLMFARAARDRRRPEETRAEEKELVDA